MELYSIINKYKEDYYNVESIEPLRRKTLLTIILSGLSFWIILFSFILRKFNIPLIAASLFVIFLALIGIMLIDKKEEEISKILHCTTYNRRNIYQYDGYFIINKWQLCKLENPCLFVDDELPPINLTEEQYQLILEKSRKFIKPIYVEGNILDVYKTNKIDTKIMIIEL